MIKRQWLVLLLMCLGATVGIKASHNGILECSINQFSLLLFTLEKNVVRIERYGLNELMSEINRFSRHESNEHCIAMLNLGEHRQRVVDIEWSAMNMEDLLVTTIRSKNPIVYALDWSSLVAYEDAQVQEFMRANARINDVFNIDFSNGGHVDRAVRWFTSLAVEWGVGDENLTISLIIERKIERVCGAVVPNCFLDDNGDMGVIWKKDELIDAGVLTLLPQDDGMATRAQDHVGDLCTDELGVDLDDVEENQSFISSCYYSVGATLSAIGDYLYSWVSCS
ncbi:MAG: hypothetical protein NTX86_06230 [Candidatus Dependentiae bacterium]|nr:hypothetical protein [Candidatus Dependentiae bacterium]